MTAEEPASLYMVFVLEARGNTETRIVSIRPATSQAAAAIRARAARVKETWGVGHPVVPIGLGSGKEEGDGE
jgi:hypothetical protein